MNYKITNELGQKVPHSNIRGLKLAIQNRRTSLKEGIFKCVCPSGNIHTWEIIQDRSHTCSGTAKKKIKVGKGVIKPHYIAKLKSVK